jgi:hypothetical protein
MSSYVTSPGRLFVHKWRLLVATFHKKPFAEFDLILLSSCLKNNAQILVPSLQLSPALLLPSPSSSVVHPMKLRPAAVHISVGEEEKIAVSIYQSKTQAVLSPRPLVK